MARADGIDVEALHRQHVLQHLLAAHGASRLLTMVMTIDAVHHEALAVDEQGAVAADAYRAEPDFAGTHIDQFAVGSKQAEGQVVELGVFGAPAFHAGKGEVLCDAGRGGECAGEFLDDCFAVADGHLQFHALE